MAAFLLPRFSSPQKTPCGTPVTPHLDEVDDLSEYDISAGLTDGGSGLGPNAYEIIAFTASANAEALGNVAYVGPFLEAHDVRQLAGGTVPADHRSTHSFQFHHPSSITWDFWNRLNDSIE